MDEEVNEFEMENKRLSNERFKEVLNFLKWAIGTAGIAIVTLIIDTGFKDRTAAIQEMQAYDEYVDEIIKADNIEVRWKLAEYFSLVTPSSKLRERWTEYKDSISDDYQKYQNLKLQQIELSRLKNEGDDSVSTAASAELNGVIFQLSQFTSSLGSSSNSTEEALKFEDEGFQHLLDKDVDNAIQAFINSDRSYSGFHNAFEISRLLREYRGSLIDEDSDSWISVYTTILQDLSWKMPEYYRIKLQEILDNDSR